MLTFMMTLVDSCLCLKRARAFMSSHAFTIMYLAPYFFLIFFKKYNNTLARGSITVTDSLKTEIELLHYGTISSPLFFSLEYLDTSIVIVNVVI